MWIKNLRNDLYKIKLYCKEINNYLDILNSNKNNLSVMYFSLLNDYNETLKAILILLESNYHKEDELQTSRINNMSGIFILLRKLIETEATINVLLNNKEELHELYLAQKEFDEAYIASKFKDSSSAFKQSKIPRSRYFWLNKYLGKNISSINDLINTGNYTKESKLMLELWLYECNYMSHPNLYNDNVIVENFNGMFINTLRYIFEVLEQTSLAIYSMIEHIESVDKTKTSYQISSIYNKIPKFNIFNNDYFEKSYLNNNIIYPFTNIDFNNYAYNIRAEYSFINASVTTTYESNKLSDRKRRTIGKLLDQYVEDLKDLVIGFYNKNNIIFYTKIRQVFESIAYIDLVLNMNEEEVEVYQAYTDIQRHKRSTYSIDKFNKLNNNNIKTDKELINSDEKLTIEQAYNLNVKFVKDYFLNKFNVKIKTNLIKRTNSFAFDGKTVPSNWDLIRGMIDRNNAENTLDVNYFDGLYSLSSLHCHVNYFTYSNHNLNEDRFYIEIMRNVMNVVKINYDKLFDLLPQELKEILPLKNSTVNKILYNLYNYDIIKVPNPY
jgi:hypothetical protein